MPRQLFVFIQLEYPWTLGPADGRYLLRRESDGEPERVVVLGTLEAGRQKPLGVLPADGRGAGSPLRRLRGRGRARTAPTGPEPAAVSTSRATVIDPVSLAAENQARAWLAELDGEREVDTALAVVNRVIHSHRIAAADPYVHEVSAAQALVIRAGWGEGEQVADGRWLHARALTSPARAGGASHALRTGRSRPPRARERSWALRPQERLAALLGAREAPLLCEELALRAHGDLERGRLAHAALELDRAFALATLELRAERRQDLAIRLSELEQLRAGVHAQAQAAEAQAARAATTREERLTAAGPPQGKALDEEILAHGLARLQAALRARTATGIDR
jgi:hypothetical protein